MGFELYKRIIKPRARADVSEIFAYLSQFSLEHADGVVLELTAAIDTLEYLPKRFRVRHKRKDDHLTVYLLVSNPYLIYYRVSDSDLTVNILTVLHGARRQPKRFGSKYS